MRPFTRALLRLPWTLSQQGFEQLEKRLAAQRASSGSQHKTSDVFDATLRVLGAQFEVLLADVFKAEDYLHAEPVNKALSTFSPGGPASSEALKWGFDMGSRAADTLLPLTGDGTNGIALQEFRNKLHAFSTFRYVDAVLGLAFNDQTPLAELLARVDRLDPYTAVWATEGLGFYYAERARKAGRLTRRLLAEGAVRALPARYMIALHAGLGLSLARQYLGKLPHTASLSELDQVVRHFMDHCRTAARPGYAPVSFEALGLVTRLLYPQWVEPIDRILSPSSPDQAAFWHGVGRGLYFLPTNLLPASHPAARTLKSLLAEVPHETARLNTISGLAWPLSLVNIYQPEVMEAFLRHHGKLLEQDDAFSVGVSSALMTWHDLTEDPSYRTVFCHHQPNPIDADTQARWEYQIKEPSLSALNHYYEIIKQGNAFGELFRYQSLADLVASLKRQKN